MPILLLLFFIPAQAEREKLAILNSENSASGGQNPKPSCNNVIIISGVNFSSNIVMASLIQGSASV
jgi:hypothetical protein